MKKKALLLLMALSMAFSLAACGKKETPEAPEKSDARKPNKVVTALGLDPALWTSIMGAAGLGMTGAAHLSRRDKKKKDEE